MHILYVDDSGSVKNASEKYFVLGGVAAFERRLYHMITEVDQVVSGFEMGDPHEIELHGSAMYNGRDEWAHFARRADREPLIHKALSVMTGRHTVLTLFGVAVEKQWASPRDPVEVAFEEILNRFNMFLQRLNNRAPENPQRGLIVMDRNDHEGDLQSLARHFRINGGRWGHFRNLAEVPMFVDSKACRGIQLADLTAWTTFRKYEYLDGRFFDQLIRKFDADGGVIHGLVHHKRRGDTVCYCPACQTRQARDMAQRLTLVPQTAEEVEEIDKNHERQARGT